MFILKPVASSGAYILVTSILLSAINLGFCTCAETSFQKFVTDNLQRLRDLSEQDLCKEFKDLKLNLRQGFVSTGMGDLKTKLLTVAEAKKRKLDMDTHSRKQQKLLLQAEQPRAVVCAV